MNRKDNTQYILSLSYGKDSIACLEAIKRLELPLDRIIHTEIWATDTIQADLPPMVEFKEKADKIIKDRYGIEVEHVCALDRGGYKHTYEKQFYTTKQRGKFIGTIYGFPMVRSPWCRSKLKTNVYHRICKINIRKDILSSCDKRKNERENLRMAWISSNGEANMVHRGIEKESFSESSHTRGANTNIVRYLGIAADEPERIKRHTKPGIILPLVEIGWDESYCRKWCEENDLLSPIYTTAARGGCWFCHNQSASQLRLLRKTYPELWNLLLKWDLDSPTTFKPDGHTVHDFEKRFAAEDRGEIKAGDRKFRWKQVLEDKK